MILKYEEILTCCKTQLTYTTSSVTFLQFVKYVISLCKRFLNCTRKSERWRRNVLIDPPLSFSLLIPHVIQYSWIIWRRLVIVITSNRILGYYSSPSLTSILLVHRRSPASSFYTQSTITSKRTTLHSQVIILYFSLI